MEKNKLELGQRNIAIKRFLSPLLFPKAMDCKNATGGLLTCSVYYSLPVKPYSGVICNNLMELTAAGTVPDSHRIPCSDCGAKVKKI